MRRKINIDSSSKFKRRYLILAALFFIFLLIGLGFLRNNYWDGFRRFTMVIQISPKNNSSTPFFLSVFSIEPRQNRAVYFLLPTNTLLNVPYGYNTYPVSSVYKLGELEKNKKGGRLLAKSIEKTLGFAVDGYLVCEDCSFVLLPKNREEFKNFKQSFFTFRGFLRFFGLFTKKRSISTNLSFMDSLRLWNALRKIRIDQIDFWDLEKNNVFIDTKLADGTIVERIEKDLLDFVAVDSFEDSQVRTEALAIEIINATDEEGLANQFSSILGHMGANVVIKSTAKEKEKRACLLFFSQKDIMRRNLVSRLKQLYDCQINEQTVDLTHSDIRIVLGEGFLK